MKNWLKVFSLFFVLGLLIYFNSLNNKFLMDDYAFLNKPFLSGTKFILSQWNPYQEQTLGVLGSQIGYYRPMTHMVYDFCYATFKNNYWQYHLFNLCLFAFASSLIYLLIEKITGNYNLAFLTGLFYLVHPINGIVVNYISASVFAFQVICILGAILLLLEALERKNDRTLYILSLFFSFLSLFWHESGVMTPFYICVVILLFRKDSLKEKVFYLFPYFLIVFSYIFFRIFFLGTNVNILKQMTFFHMTGWEYLATLFRLMMWYILQLFYPQAIVMQWAMPVLHEHIILNVLGLGLLLMIFLLFFVRFVKEKILQMAIIWAVIGFVPVFLSALIMRYNSIEIESHWFIFSSIGFFISAAYFCLFLLDRTKKIGFVLLFTLIFSWGAVSHANNQLWADQKTYALYWSQQVPSLKLPYFYLADAYQKEGASKESRKYYRLALSGDQSDVEIYINLGVIDQTNGNFKNAESNYRMALKIYPYSASAYNNLGAIYFTEGEFDKAKEYFDRSLMLSPFQLEPRRNLASILLKNSEYQKAIDLCLKNLDIVKDDPKTLLLLIDIFIREKDFISLKEYAHYFINGEKDPEVLTKLGILMAQNNMPKIAIDCFTKVIRVAPDYKDAYLAAGTVFANLGEYDQAIHIWKIGSSIDLSDKRFNTNISKAMLISR